MANEALLESLSGAISSGFAAALFCPVEVIKTKLQGNQKSNKGEKEYTGTLDVIRDVLEKQGVGGFFQGFRIIIARAMLTDALYFWISTSLRAQFETRIRRKLSSIQAVASGMISACLTQLVAHPVDTVVTRYITDQSNQTFSCHIQTLLEEQGALSLWRGYQASMILSINPALQFTVFERAKSILELRLKVQKLSSKQVFLLGMGTKALTLSLIYPLIRAKVRFQARRRESGDEKGAAEVDLVESIVEMVETEGVLSLYKGLKEQIGKSMLSTALLLTSKEAIRAFLQKHLST